MADPAPRGRFVWHELNTTDPKAAEAFYTAVVGWTMTPWPDNPDYRMWTKRDGGTVGGVMMLPDQAKQMGAPPHWLAYIAVADVDATVRQAAALGARTFVQPTDIPNVGRFAVLADPWGAIFAPFRTAAQWPGHDGEPKVGEFSWHELTTKDWSAATSFYSALFGWEKMQSMDMGPEGVYQMFGRNGVMLGGIYNKRATDQSPPRWLTYVMVPNVDKAVAQITSRGGRVVSGPMDVPGGSRIVNLLDPQGALFALQSVAAAAPSPSKPKATAKAKPKKKAKAKAKKKPVKAKAKAKKKPVKQKPAKKKAKRPARRAARKKR